MKRTSRNFIARGTKGENAMPDVKDGLKLSRGSNATAKPVTPPGNARNRALVPRRGIIVAQKYRIASDPNNILLQKRHLSKRGNEYWETIGFYLTLGAAVRGLVREGIKETELADIQTVLDRITQLEQDILKLAAGK